MGLLCKNQISLLDHLTQVYHSITHPSQSSVDAYARVIANLFEAHILKQSHAQDLFLTVRQFFNQQRKVSMNLRFNQAFFNTATFFDQTIQHVKVFNFGFMLRESVDLR